MINKQGTKMFIIAKYAHEYYPSGKAGIDASIADTYTIRELGIPRGPYVTREEAEGYLPVLNEFNPAVGYGVLELDLEQPRTSAAND